MLVYQRVSHIFLLKLDTSLTGPWMEKVDVPTRRNLLGEMGQDSGWSMAMVCDGSTGMVQRINLGHFNEEHDDHDDQPEVIWPGFPVFPGRLSQKKNQSHGGWEVTESSMWSYWYIWYYDTDIVSIILKNHISCLRWGDMMWFDVICIVGFQISLSFWTMFADIFGTEILPQLHGHLQLRCCWVPWPSKPGKRYPLVI